MLLIRRGDGEWHEPEVSRYENERALQDLVMKSPSLLPGMTPMAIVDEFSIPGIGSIDLVGVGPTGEITVVECKLRANPQIRREVVGQVFAYAGGLWKMPYEQFAANFERRARVPLIDALSELGEGQVDEPTLRLEIGRRLEEGDLRLIITVDEITPELRTIIEYLNEHTVNAVQVLALELGFAKEGDLELLIPSVYGEETASRKARSTAVNQWTAASFAEALERVDDDAVKAFIERLLDHGAEQGHAPNYGTGRNPTLSYFYLLGGQSRSLWQVVLHENGPHLVISFGSILKWSLERATRLLADLTASPELAAALVAMSADDLNRYPSIPITTALADKKVQDQFFASLDALIAGGEDEPLP